VAGSYKVVIGLITEFDIIENLEGTLKEVVEKNFVKKTYQLKVDEKLEA
jgi:hypothetical protein